MHVDTDNTPASRRAYFTAERERLDQAIAAALGLMTREVDILTAHAAGDATASREFDRLEQAHRELPELRRQRDRVDAVLGGLAAHDHRWRMQRAVEDAAAARGEAIDALRRFRDSLVGTQAAGEAALEVLRRVEAAAFTHSSYLDRLRTLVEAPAGDVSQEQREACVREIAILEAQGFPVDPATREVMHGIALLMKYLRVSNGSLDAPTRFMRDSAAVLATAGARKKGGK